MFSLELKTFNRAGDDVIELFVELITINNIPCFIVFNRHETAVNKYIFQACAPLFNSR